MHNSNNHQAKKHKDFGIINIFKLLICELLAHTSSIFRPHISISSIRKLPVPNNKQKPTNRWHLSAEGFLLLPSALRPHLLGKKCKKSSFRDIFRDKIVSNYAKNHQKLLFLVKNTQFLAILALLQIVAVSTIFGYLCSNPVSAASLTLTIPSSFSLDITPGANGVFSKSSEQKINVKTDNSSGYTLSIKAKNSENSNVLLNGSNKLNSISESTTEDLFKSDTKFNNTWGYLPSKFNNEDNTNFLPGPTTEESILETTNEASPDGNDYTISLAAKVDNTIGSGAYTNSFVISALVNETPDDIIQNWTGCADLEDGQTVKLLDIRDNNIYKVAKLKDGKCWMTQNLRLGDNKLKNRTLTSEDSNVETDFTLPSSSASGFNKYNTSYLQYMNQEYGTYYSWYAATAGQGTGEDNRNTDTRITTTSICPSGWHLPSKSETTELVSHYDYSTIQESPANFSLAGANRAGVVSDQEIKGMFWAANAYDNKYGYMIVINNSTGALGAAESFGDKAYGFAVRCIIEPKKTMQNVEQWGDNVKDNEVVEAEDIRDGNIYKVSRLKDGELWMTQNLRIQDKEISSEDSDMADGTFTIPASDLENFGTEQDTSYVYVDTENNKYGGYYSWHTATAGQGNIILGGSVDSICPKGWHLPTKDEFSDLATNYTSSTIRNAPANFSAMGHVSSGAIKHEVAGDYGEYWSSGNYDDYFKDSTTSSNVLEVSSILHVTSAARYYGNYIRCVAGNNIVKDYSITYDLNGGTAGPSPNPQTDKKLMGNSASVELSSAIPTNGEHLFFGWCTVNPGDSRTCSGSQYSSGGKYTFAGDSNEVTLYAIWGPEYRSTCNETGIVLKDGKCWSKDDVRSSVSWSTANSLCSSPWWLPGRYTYNDLLNSYYPNGWNNVDTSEFAADWGVSGGSWWTSTRETNNNYYYYMSLGSSGAHTNSSTQGNAFNLKSVRCVSNAP